ncbi:MAG TPA: CAP domain-containing protein [Syntrophorhabdaceae bacterium]|nr:CAP domain-containing protein [Syntrophorhabdaceae bacterium]
MSVSLFFASVKRLGNHLRPTRESTSLIIFLTAVVIASLASATVSFGISARQKEQLTKEAIIELTNSARASEGLSTLDENPVLDSIAEARAKDILEKQYFAHVSPTGEQASHIALKVGYRYRVISENLARGVFSTNGKLIDAWMNSPSHRKNILSSRMREIGVSVVKGTFNGTETWISVQIFGLQFDAGSGKSISIASGRTPGSDLRASNSSMEEGLHDKILRLKRELDLDKAAIQRIPRNDPQAAAELARRTQSYAEKLERYNVALAETKAVRVAMNQ